VHSRGMQLGCDCCLTARTANTRHYLQYYVRLTVQRVVAMWGLLRIMDRQGERGCIHRITAGVHQVNRGANPAATMA
jgi:hypothetical protein